MDKPDIDSGSLPAVRNLRSRFEQLGQDQSPSISLRPGPHYGELTIPEPSSPRPRASSSTHANSSAQDIHHLRSTSSSSDLQAAIKRPPPPPPPSSRGSRVPSASSPAPPSPLLRPVPTPPSHSPKPSQEPSWSDTGADESGGVAVLRNKFNTTPRVHSPRQSFTSTYPELSIATGAAGAKPTIPPRAPVFSPSHPIAQSPEDTLFAHPHQRTDSSSDGDSTVLLTSSASTSPAPSPLLRPVPAPPVSHSKPRVPSGSPRLPTPRLPSVNIEGEEVLQDVSALRGKFNTTPRINSPRQSFVATYPELAVPMNAGNKPAIPPRHASLSSSHRISQTPDTPSHSRTPSDADSMVSTPPTLPARKPYHHHHHESSTSSLSTSGSSQTSSESDISQHSIPQKPSRSGHLPPPRPPPRNKGCPASSEPIPSPAQVLLSPPPPLPTRRGTALQTEEGPAGRPRLPNRPQVSIPSTPGSESPVPSPSVERKSLGSARLPPPPTRTIALGSKLPPARRAQSPSSDEDSADEDDTKHAIDTLPDSSRSSRRPPILSFREGYSEPRIPVHAYTGHAAVSGTTIVVTSNHHIKIYNLSVSDAPVHNLETKEVGVKEIKVTSMEFRPSAKKGDRGNLLWVGTKEGHLLELDIRTGAVVGSKLSAHLHPVTHIFRYAGCMITLDDSGKVLVFSPNEDDISLSLTQPRVVRITEKQDFVRLIGGRLWTAARGDHHGAGTSMKTPIIRIYDILTPGSTGRSVLPSEHVGPVTSATIVPSHPGHAYLGHEEGFITIWDLETEDGHPCCIEVMKVSGSDVLCVAGVNDRLWAGGRNGMISAYDVAPRPWVVTNCWNAHPGLPVLKLIVDCYGIEKTGRLCVASIGRDEQLRLWDGLLGMDWVDQELLKRETSFSKFRNLTVLIVSWNVDSARPDALTGEAANLNFLHDVLNSVDSPDVISFGFQEVIDLESRKMTAKNVLLGSKKKAEDGGLSEKVTGAYKRWYDCLLLAVRLAMPPDCPYSVIHTESLVGLFSCIFVKNTERVSLKDLSVTTIKRGMGGRYGNKGGIVARLVIEDSSICLINCHLAAGQNAIRQRNADVAGMLEERAVFPATEHPLAYVGGGDGSMVLDHEIVFFNGDMNYRIDHRRDAIIAAIRAQDHESLISHDQLLREIKYNRGCRFRGFMEGPLTFAPTYKYDRRSNEYDSSEKHRAPAWCDRVLWRSRIPNRVQQLHYRRYEANVSDHRPISAAFKMTTKSVRHDVREKVKYEVQATWIDQQNRLLSAAHQFYISQSLI
ncbi:hypothetical protein BD779DRAFT_1643882 [Infundibulicybe gibba]|nr:hypothetical protein BD779DRAFT_1643882 [Infundibulicybe gibba]